VGRINFIATRLKRLIQKILRIYSPIETTIILVPLLVRGSYIEDREIRLEELEDNIDTLQWIINDDITFRIRTFALDYDIHIHKVGKADFDIVEYAIQSNHKYYGNIMHRQYAQILNNFPALTEGNELLESLGLPGEFRPLFDKYMYWSPDREEYFSQSRPE